MFDSADRGTPDRGDQRVLVETYNVGPVFLDPQSQTSSAASLQFIYRNRSTRTVALSVGRGCLCTEAKLGKNVLGPGETTPFTLTFPLAYSRATASQSAVVSAEDGSV